MSRAKDLEEINEEFNNFMHKLNEVSNIITKMNSDDKRLQEIGTFEAEQYLRDKNEQVYENIDEETVKLTIKNDKTLINSVADGPKDQNSMSQEAFMREVGKDAEQRYKDRQIRKERSDTFKRQATKAFRIGDYAKALTLYDKAIGQIKDSCMLYINRSLTQINLGRYEKGIEDAERALQLNENSLKARLLLAKAHYLNENKAAFKKKINEAKERNPDQGTFIDEYVAGLLGNTKKEAFN